ncbi:MAG TPA: hypothetical protein VF912_05740 [Anaeromyxobacter sp.]
MPEIQKTDAKRPPPLPSQAAPTPVPNRRPLAGPRAFLEIRRLRLADSARRLWQRVRRRPVLVGVVVVVIAAVAAGGAAIAYDVVPEITLNAFAPATVSTARADARARPNDAAAQRALGHALWAAKRRHAAVQAYERALALDATVADGETIANLLASFGGRNQREAEALIWKNKLVAAEDGLRTLAKSKTHGVRWGAVHTLDRLEKGSKAYWETAYILDLDSSKCETRRTAVEKLGTIGTRRAVAALREAKADDEKTGGWFRSRCLGERVDDAEQKILARR